MQPERQPDKKCNSQSGGIERNIAILQAISVCAGFQNLQDNAEGKQQQTKACGPADGGFRPCQQQECDQECRGVGAIVEKRGSGEKAFEPGKERGEGDQNQKGPTEKQAGVKAARLAAP